MTIDRCVDGRAFPRVGREWVHAACMCGWASVCAMLWLRLWTARASGAMWRANTRAPCAPFREAVIAAAITAERTRPDAMRQKPLFKRVTTFERIDHFRMADRNLIRTPIDIVTSKPSNSSSSTKTPRSPTSSGRQEG